MIVSSE